MKVVVYDKEHCPKCLFTERKLEAHNIPFETRNILAPENKDTLDWAQESGNVTLPLVFVDDEFAWGDLKMDEVDKLVAKAK